jgi:hypothetical protein
MRCYPSNPIYNSCIRAIPISAGRSRTACLFWLLLYSSLALAADWQKPSEQLARRIAAVTGPGAIAVNVTNRSSLSSAQVEEIHRKLLTELASFGIQPTAPDQASGNVEISLSESLGGYLWVAEIHVGKNEPVVTMVTLPAGLAPAPDESSVPITIHKTLLWTSEARLLDVVLVGSNPAHMIVLEPESVTLYRQQNGKWEQEQVLGVKHSHPWPRDLRGRLIPRSDHLFDAYLPGVYCRSSAIAPLTLVCSDSDDPWPLSGNSSALNAFFSPNRNFFTGALAPGIGKQTTTVPFFSAAPVPRDGYTLWVIASVEGPVHLLDGLNDLTLTKLGWGSDIASVHSGCGTGWQVLSDSDQARAGDQLKAFEVEDREPVLVSRAAEFSGPITALWPAPDSSSAIAVEHNFVTGNYEAYSISLDCRQ